MSETRLILQNYGEREMGEGLKQDYWYLKEINVKTLST
jgi:hypothetical protein